MRPEPYDIKMDRIMEEELRCIHAIRKPIQRGEKNYGSYDICRLNGKACLIEHGHYTCSYYEEWLKEETNARNL